jgi:hypothetical protein
LAALTSDARLVEAMLLAQANVHARTKKGYSAADLASTEEIDKLLRETLVRAGADPEAARAQAVVEAFLRAKRAGDAAGMKTCLVPPNGASLPDRAEKEEIQWTVQSVQVGPVHAIAHYKLTTPAVPGGAGEFQAVFRLQRAAGTWRIDKIELLPHAGGTSQKEKAP